MPLTKAMPGLDRGKREAVVFDNFVKPSGVNKPLGIMNGAASPNVSINIINQSSSPVQATQTGQPQFNGREFVIGVILQDIEEGGATRRAIQGVR